MKFCNKCKEEKPITDFYMKRCWNRPDDGLKHYRSVCKKCWQQQNRIHIRNSMRRYPEKVSARLEVKRAVKSGKLVKLVCRICSDKLSFAHHNDYTKPLEIVWLCRNHHEDLHHGRLELELVK